MDRQPFRDKVKPNADLDLHSPFSRLERFRLILSFVLCRLIILSVIFIGQRVHVIQVFHDLDPLILTLPELSLIAASHPLVSWHLGKYLISQFHLASNLNHLNGKTRPQSRGSVSKSDLKGWVTPF